VLAAEPKERKPKNKEEIMAECPRRLAMCLPMSQNCSVAVLKN
jgi:hypothetical protein